MMKLMHPNYQYPVLQEGREPKRNNDVFAVMSPAWCAMYIFAKMPDRHDDGSYSFTFKHHNDYFLKIMDAFQKVGMLQFRESKTSSAEEHCMRFRFTDAVSAGQDTEAFQLLADNFQESLEALNRIKVSVLAVAAARGLDVGKIDYFLYDFNGREACLRVSELSYYDKEKKQLSNISRDFGHPLMSVYENWSAASISLENITSEGAARFEQKAQEALRVIEAEQREVERLKDKEEAKIKKFLPKDQADAIRHAVAVVEGQLGAHEGLIRKVAVAADYVQDRHAICGICQYIKSMSDLPDGRIDLTHIANNKLLAENLTNLWTLYDIVLQARGEGAPVEGGLVSQEGSELLAAAIVRVGENQQDLQRSMERQKPHFIRHVYERASYAVPGLRAGGDGELELAVEPTAAFLPKGLRPVVVSYLAEQAENLAGKDAREEYEALYDRRGHLIREEAGKGKPKLKHDLTGEGRRDDVESAGEEVQIFQRRG